VKPKGTFDELGLRSYTAISIAASSETSYLVLKKSGSSDVIDSLGSEE
jgi:hypothetical protein